MKKQIDRYRPLIPADLASAETVQVGGALNTGGDIGDESLVLLVLSSDTLNAWYGSNLALPGQIIAVYLPVINREVDYSRLSAQSQADQSGVIAGVQGACVSIFPQRNVIGRAPSEIALPEIYFSAGEWCEEIPEMDGLGIGVSKIGGLPCWLQEPLIFPGFDFVLQLDEYDLVKYLPMYDDKLLGGVGYLFLESLLLVALRGDGKQRGIFVVQYS